jgi:diketogulonate reductase-like aldo/keto reductase
VSATDPAPSPSGPSPQPASPLACFRQQSGVVTHRPPSALGSLGSISKVDVLGRPEVQSVAQAKNKTAAQVAIRWLVQQGITAVTATSSPTHAAEALGVFNFSLTRKEMRQLSALR